MKLQRLIPLFLIIVLIAMPATQVFAQGNQRGQCQQFIRKAYSDLGTNCLKLESNSVCYGHEDVTGMMIPGNAEPAGFFAEPGFRSELTNIAIVTGSPFSLADEIWGLAKLNILTYSADVEDDDPDTLDDNLRDVLMLLMGDMEVENGVLPTFDDEGNLVIDAETLGPFNKIYTRGGSDVPECEEAVPPLLLFQGDEDASTTLVINDLEMELVAGSTNKPQPTTIVIQLYDSQTPFGQEDTMRITVLAGLLKLNPGAADEMPIAPGYYTEVCLDDPQDRGDDANPNDLTVSCPPLNPQLITEDMLDLLRGLQGLPGNILKKPVVPPIIIKPSGPGAKAQIVFSDRDALELAREACAAEELPAAICELLFG